MKRIRDREHLRMAGAARAERTFKGRVAFAAWRKRRNAAAFARQQKRNAQRPKYSGSYNHVEAPDAFCLLSNTNDCVRFISKLEYYYNRRSSVYVELENVLSIDEPAIAVLLAIMVKFKSERIAFNGSLPVSQRVADTLRRSGFFKKLYSVVQKRDRYDISRGSGRRSARQVQARAWKKVDPEFADSIVGAMSTTIWGERRRCQGVYRVIIELMQNTNNHARIGRAGGEHWWLLINHDEAARRVSFSFVDLGVGIFNSLDGKDANSKWVDWKPKMIMEFGAQSNPDLLRSIMDGDLHRTVTRKHYRGKGLPGIAEAVRRSQISNLWVVTNNASCCIDARKFEQLTESFNGTLIYWEVNESHANCA